MFDFLFQNLRNRRKSEIIVQGPEKPKSRTLPSRATDVVFNPFGRIADAVKTTVQEINRGDEARSEEEMRALLEEIAVVAFVGSSGTGKSTRAIRVAKDHQIAYIIDDGLLIHGSGIVAGSSAKRAATKIDSVRQALFADETRAAIMRRALLEQLPPALMILGTSRDMINRICANLWLKKPAMLIRIEDISSEEERRQAQETRLSEGKHTIPVPSMELRHEFNGYLTEPILKLKRKLDRGSKESLGPDAERTVVRPTFSTLGSYILSDEAMAQMIGLIMERVSGVAALTECRSYKEPSGISFDIKLALYYGYDAQDTLAQAQKAISEVERLSSVNVLSANLQAVRLVHMEEHSA